MEAKSYLIRLRSDCATDTIDGKVEMSQGHFDTTYSPISRSESIIGKLSLVPGHFDIQSQASWAEPIPTQRFHSDEVIRLQWGMLRLKVVLTVSFASRDSDGEVKDSKSWPFYTSKAGEMEDNNIRQTIHGQDCEVSTPQKGTHWKSWWQSVSHLDWLNVWIGECKFLSWWFSRGISCHGRSTHATM